MAKIVNVTTANSTTQVTLPGADPSTSNVVANDFRIRHGLEGPQIVISWSQALNPPIEYILIRKRGSFPLTIADGIEIYRVDSDGDFYYSDRDLEPNHYYYYTLFSKVAAGDYRFSNKSVGKELAYETGFFWDYMKARLPDYYFIRDHESTKERILKQIQDTNDPFYIGEVFNFLEDQSQGYYFFERLLKVFALEFDRIRAYTRFFPNIINVEETCSDFLPHLAATIGLKFNLDIPIDKQRSEIKSWVGTLKKKGTITSISSFVQSLTKLPVDVQEYYKNILVTNSKPLKGYSVSDRTPPIDITGTVPNQLKISIDGGNIVEVTLDNSVGESGLEIAIELETKINAALAADSQLVNVNVFYKGDRPNDHYSIFSKRTGETSSVIITPGTSDITSVIFFGVDNNGNEDIGGGVGVTDLSPQNVQNSVGLYQDSASYLVDTRLGARGSKLQGGFSRSAFNPVINLTGFLNNNELTVAIDGQTPLLVEIDNSNGEVGLNVAAEMQLKINEYMNGGGFSRSDYAPIRDITLEIENQFKISVDGGNTVEVTLNNAIGIDEDSIVAEMETKINATLAADSQIPTVSVYHRGVAPRDSYVIFSNLEKSTSSSVIVTAGTSDLSSVLKLGETNSGTEQVGNNQEGSVTVLYKSTPPNDYYIIISELKGATSSIEVTLGNNDITRFLKLGTFFKGEEVIGTDNVSDYLFNFNKFSIFVNLLEEFSDLPFGEAIWRKIGRKLPDVIPATTEANIWLEDFTRNEIDFTRPNVDIIDEKGLDEITGTNCEAFVPFNKWMTTAELGVPPIHFTNTYIDPIHSDCLIPGAFTAYLIVNIFDEYDDLFITDAEENIPLHTDSQFTGSDFITTTDEESVSLSDSHTDFIEDLYDEVSVLSINDSNTDLIETDDLELFEGLINLENQFLTNSQLYLTNQQHQLTAKNIFDSEYIDTIITI